jgi:two-component SAPR family response regulator
MQPFQWISASDEDVFFYLVPFHRNNDCNKNGSIKDIYKQTWENKCNVETV